MAHFEAILVSDWYLLIRESDGGGGIEIWVRAGFSFYVEKGFAGSEK